MNTAVNKLVSTLLLTSVLCVPTFSQTRIAVPENKIDIKNDVEISRLATKEFEPQLSIIDDVFVTDYLKSICDPLVEAIPWSYRYSDFRYAFKVVDTPVPGVYGLPGGSVYVSRRLIQDLRNGSELAGIIAHAIGHIALRHYTARLSKRKNVDWRLVRIGLLEALRGHSGKERDGRVYRYYDYMNRFDVAVEKQADLFGAQLMGYAGYDPNTLGNVFSNFFFNNPAEVSCLKEKDWKERKQLVYTEAEVLKTANLYHPTSRGGRGELVQIQQFLKGRVSKRQ